MRKLFVFIFLLPSALYSQGLRIQGFVVDSLTNEPLRYATIQVVDANNKTIFAGIANDSLASFNFSKLSIEAGYKVLISYVGYQKKEIPVNIEPHQKFYDFGVIYLSNYNTINEVKVIGQRRVQDLIDRTIYLVDSTLLSKVVATSEILGSFSEIQVNPITLETKIKGKENTLILVNGINNGQSIDIRSINPKDIERVEVITSPPSSVDVEYDGIINIVLKHEPRKGISGNIDATFMPNGRYVDGYSGIVFGNNKTRLNVMYNNYLRNNSWKTSEIRNNLNTNSSYLTNGYCTNPFENTHNFIANLDYYPDQKSFINISTQNSIATIDKNIQFNPLSINDGDSTLLTPFSIQNASDYFIGNYTLFYRRNFQKEGNSLTANVNLHYMDGLEYSDYSYEGASTHINDEHAKKQSANMKIEYVNHLSNLIRLTTGIQTYYQKFTGTLSETSLENDFSNTRYNGYADLYLKIKGIDMNLGLKAERNAMLFSSSSQTIQQALFPSLILSKQLSKTDRVKLEYRRTTFYPSAWNFSPYRIEIDSMTAFVGNPKLRPSKRNAIEFSHSFRKSSLAINSMIYFYSTNNLVSSIKSYDSNNFCTITYDNSTDRMFTGFKLTGSIGLFQFIQIEPNINLYYENYNHQGNIQHNTAYSTYLFMSIGLPKGFGVGAFGSYYGKALSVQGYTDPHYSLDALFIMKRFFKQNLNLYLALRGLVNSKVTTLTYDGNNEEYRIFKQDTFGLAFRITYLFNIGKKYDLEQVSTYFETDKK